MMKEKEKIKDENVKELITDEEQLREISEFMDINKEYKDIKRTFLELKATMEAKDLYALSAPQIGKLQRIFCIRDKKGVHCFVNPMIQKSTDVALSRERDENFPDKEYLHFRSSRLTMEYQDQYTKQNRATEQVGYSAFVFQRMIDHLNGALTSDIGLEIDELWDDATDEERAEVIKAYVESLNRLNIKLNEEIDNDEHLKKQMKAIEFEHALLSGEVEVEQRKVTEEEKEQIEAKLKQVAEENK